MFFKATDDELMAKVARGQKDALRRLLERHCPQILGYCCRLMANAETGETIAQSVWIKAVTLSPHYRGDGKFIYWILNLAKSACLIELRKQGINFLAPNYDQTNPSGELKRDPNEDRKIWEQPDEEFCKRIDSLPVTERVAMMMWMSNHSSLEEIASETGLSASDIRRILCVARASIHLKDGQIEDKRGAIVEILRADSDFQSYLSGLVIESHQLVGLLIYNGFAFEYTLSSSEDEPIKGEDLFNMLQISPQTFVTSKFKENVILPFANIVTSDRISKASLKIEFMENRDACGVILSSSEKQITEVVTHIDKIKDLNLKIHMGSGPLIA